ncbi:MAG: D-aminoacylase [Bacteroidia bacterium]|nr:D-aminoacylase [Bacteroidia bacterium]
MRTSSYLPLALLLITGCHEPAHQQVAYDIIIRNGTVYDGLGNKPIVADVAIQHDTIAAIGDLLHAKGVKEINAEGYAVAPGFINMLSWADRSLLMDGRSMSDIKQGVTLEVFGEGWSAAPVKRNLKEPVDSLWTTLDAYFSWMTKKGVSTNVASLVGATTVRIYVLEHDNRAPTDYELEQMKSLVKEAMEDGALGLGASLIYAPADYASTEELIALASVAGKYGGIYATHMRSESDNIIAALGETFRIAREANVHAEIYHLKINHERNWNKIDTVLNKIDSARHAGLSVGANMYPYTASATGLTARLPTWIQEGGAKAMRKRLKNPTTRAKVLKEMREGIPTRNSDPADVMMLGFRKDSLNELYRGKRLDEVAKMHGKDADETAIDLILEDKSTIGAVYYLQSEQNVRKIIQLPYISFGSDGASMSDAKAFEDWGTHPRAYGTFARVLGKYVREEHLLTLEEAIRKLTSLPAGHLHLQRRGQLKPGYMADVVVFDAEKISDMATFDQSRQYAEGVSYVFVNGTMVLDDGEHTNATPGRVVRGAGWKQP